MYITENKFTVMMKTEQNIYERRNIQQRGEIHETFKKIIVQELNGLHIQGCQMWVLIKEGMVIRTITYQSENK